MFGVPDLCRMQRKTSQVGLKRGEKIKGIAIRVTKFAYGTPYLRFPFVDRGGYL